MPDSNNPEPQLKPLANGIPPFDPSSVPVIEPEPPEQPGPPGPRSRAQKNVAIAIVAYGVGMALYTFLINTHLWHTSAMFIGIPCVLAIVLALSPRPRSATGSILRGMAIALLLIAPLLGEGYLCILLASPLFLVVGLVIGAIVDSSRAKRSTTLSCVILFMLPFCLEGIVPWLTHSRSQSVTASAVVDAPLANVESALAQSPAIASPLPRFLRIGFPRPIAAYGTGLTLNSTRTIHFTGAEGDPPGDLVMHVTASRPGYVRFDTVSDSSKLTQWIYWRTSEITYTPVDATHTRVTWRISFDRQLDPWWYFTPWERFAVYKSAQYLITANATPDKLK